MVDNYSLLEKSNCCLFFFFFSVTWNTEIGRKDPIYLLIFCRYRFSQRWGWWSLNDHYFVVITAYLWWNYKAKIAIHLLEEAKTGNEVTGKAMWKYLYWRSPRYSAWSPLWPQGIPGALSDLGLWELQLLQKDWCSNDAAQHPPLSKKQRAFVAHFHSQSPVLSKWCCLLYRCWSTVWTHCSSVH